MSLRFACVCGQLLVVPDDQAGLTGQCPRCQRYVCAPSTSDTLETIASPAVPRSIRSACACGQLIVVPAMQAGRLGHCPACGEVMRIRAAGAGPMAVARFGEPAVADNEQPVLTRPGGPGVTRACPLCREQVNVQAGFCLACSSSILGAARPPRPKSSVALAGELDRIRVRVALWGAVLGTLLLNPLLSMVSAGCALRSTDRSATRSWALIFGMGGTALGCAAVAWAAR